ncbi:GHMP kinase [Kordia sp. YSTF-M3]|uniref:GHMP kinase n=1 Tax=Kordia aestuariivivens TaxID=2759037 RepID=A0ABR7QAQ0_9FLAO|nr:GYDIA family GHMP kinase [Kordia aestuariivivens]MBC8755421.1 GHMP kinase [Kordia aestuariivivens]
MNFYSNGKLLLTGEYVVLDGAKAFAIPTKYGQSLVATPINEPKLIWESLDSIGNVWFQHEFNLDSITSETTHTDEVSQTLNKLLAEAKRLNPEFLNNTTGFHVKTTLTFPRNWGLGSSSTLIHNIALWANVNPYTLLWNAFKGSGYDIACAKHHTPIIYEINDQQPKVTEVSFSPSFSDQLYFVHLNKKENSRDAIIRYNERKGTIANEIKVINAITTEMIASKSLLDFELLLKEHEQIIADIIQEIPVQERLFADYFGQIKSLGAWGGDFVLATGNEETPAYFEKKGYETVIPFSDMILSN